MSAVGRFVLSTLSSGFLRGRVRFQQLQTSCASFIASRSNPGLIHPPAAVCSFQQQSCHNFHTSSQRKDLMEFFDRQDVWGADKVVTGRPYRLDELRIKSNQDLHKLWYILLKERNMLLTMEAEYTRSSELFSNPERIEKVEESMENIMQVVRERDDAVSLLETGKPAGAGSSIVKDFLGRRVRRRHQEYAVPPHMNKVYRLLHPRSFRRANLKYLALWREKIARHKWYHYNKRLRTNQDLEERFPDLKGKLTATKPEEPKIN